MGEFSFIDQLFNVCRSVSDVLHIMLYALLIFAAIALAVYKFDEDLFNKHFYGPFLKFCYKIGLIVWYTPYQKKITRRNQPEPIFVWIFQLKWSAASNRLPYFVKIVRNFFKKF